MAFPAVAVTSSGDRITSALSHTLNLPAGMAAGDLVLMGLIVDGSGGTPPVFTWPAGWTALHGGAVINNNARVEVRYRRCDGTEAASIIVSTDLSRMMAYMGYRISGHHPSVNPVSSTGVAASTQNPNPDSLTAPFGADEDEVLWIAFVAWDQGQRWVTGYPTNYTNGFYSRSDNSGGVGIGSARRAREATTEDPGTFTMSQTSVETRAFTIAIPGRLAAPNSQAVVL